MCELRTLGSFVLVVMTSAWAVAEPGKYFRIQVVDDATGRGVPLVELTTVNNIRYFTDSAGVIAFYEPGLMDQSVFFHVKSHGYEYPKDGFGYRGARLTTTSNGQAILRIKRLNIAQRRYRVTGSGIYRDSLLLGDPTPIAQPVVNAKILGSDSVVNAYYHGKLYWFWGDTNRASYPLGNFHVPGAVSLLPDKGGLDPAIGVNLDYFVADDGFAKSTAKMPGDGPTWINALVTLNDEDGREQLFASYVKVEPPLTIYQRGLAKFRDEKNQFEKLVEFDLQSPMFPDGHTFLHSEDGVEYIYFGNPFPLIRVRASYEHLSDLTQYEAYTCLVKGSHSDSIEIERDDTEPRYRWKKDTIPFTPKLQASLIGKGLIEPQQGLFKLVDDLGKSIMIHSGSVRWNEYRKRWIMIGLQSFGSSLLGEIWFAESEQIVGPWTSARKIVTHDKYSFYNPKQHAVFDKDGGREIFFEGTYTHTFSGNQDQTPRYDYNQIMYSLDLADPRLNLPAAP